MDFKYINDRHNTPNGKTGKRFSNNVNCDSPFRVLPNFSTPPSRFCKIVNPFESHMIERIHLPTFSPSVFAKVSTPKKSDEKFKWTIDDISCLQPADIDEGTINQHVFEEDPHVESIVQQKIDNFFNEKSIVPSPITEVVRVPLLTMTPESDLKTSKHHSEGYTQTVLTLPPKLPSHVEEILKPYFTYNEDIDTSTNSNVKENSLYRRLFEPSSPTECNSMQSSPALSTGLSPLQLSPVNILNNSLRSPSRFKECSLSPITNTSPECQNRSSESRSVCRLNFSSKMSVDCSMVVPDIANQMLNKSSFLDESKPRALEILSDSTVNWDMEHNWVSLVSPSKSVDKMDVSNYDTPRTKMFVSQRKRLSDSFKDEEEFEKKYLGNEDQIRRNRKMFRNDTTDAGYHTESVAYEESLFDTHVFASTPSKRKK